MPAIATFNIDDVMSRMNPDELASLPIGAVELDRQGNILFYNQAEADITGRSNPKGFIGQNFFRDVAPCTDRPEFRGHFDKVASGAQTLAMFYYTFDFQMTPTKMAIQMKKHSEKNSIWVFVKRL
ncbi:MAG: PAS domain-containing protein [Acidobacteria bacterium]|nr:PAS domain-containing protein [Acidobacteriota bacterium]